MRYLILGLCIIAAACDSQSATGPTPPSISANKTSLEMQKRPRGGPIEVTFTKWIVIPGSPFPRAMAGFTGGDVVGTFAGAFLSGVVTGDIVHIQARYEVIDEKGRHSFQALIEGDQNNTTKTAVLNGVVTEGWHKGAPVHVAYNVISCTLAPNGVCFQGTIQVERRHPKHHRGHEWGEGEHGDRRGGR